MHLFIVYNHVKPTKRAFIFIARVCRSTQSQLLSVNIVLFRVLTDWKVFQLPLVCCNISNSEVCGRHYSFFSLQALGKSGFWPLVLLKLGVSYSCIQAIFLVLIWANFLCHLNAVGSLETPFCCKIIQSAIGVNYSWVFVSSYY